mmetsp:Transcript_60567/g.133106  ORF Transcript_60567/g.133106 Transcript_60567/m.133106 type:complete len:245 (+) Transcript_60567:86-820(+)
MATHGHKLAQHSRMAVRRSVHGCSPARRAECVHIPRAKTQGAVHLVHVAQSCCLPKRGEIVKHLVVANWLAAPTSPKVLLRPAALPILASLQLRHVGVVVAEKSNHPALPLRHSEMQGIVLGALHGVTISPPFQEPTGGCCGTGSTSSEQRRETMIVGRLQVQKASPIQGREASEVAAGAQGSQVLTRLRALSRQVGGCAAHDRAQRVSSPCNTTSRAWGSGNDAMVHGCNASVSGALAASHPG